MVKIDIAQTPPTQDEIDAKKELLARDLKSPPLCYVRMQNMFSWSLVALACITVWYFKAGFVIGSSFVEWQYCVVLWAVAGSLCVYFDRSKKRLFLIALYIYEIAFMASALLAVIATIGAGCEVGMNTLVDGAQIVSSGIKDSVSIAINSAMVALITGVPLFGLCKNDYSELQIKRQLADLEHIDPARDCESLLEWVESSEEIARYVHAVTLSGRLLTKEERYVLEVKFDASRIEKQKSAQEEKAMKACLRLQELAHESKERSSQISG